MVLLAITDLEVSRLPDRDIVVLTFDENVLVIPFHLLLKKLVENEFDIVVPKREDDAEKVFGIAFHPDTIGGKPKMITLNAISSKEAIKAAIDVDPGVDYVGITTTLKGYPAGTPIVDNTLEFLESFKDVSDEVDYTPRHRLNPPVVQQQIPVESDPQIMTGLSDTLRASTNEGQQCYTALKPPAWPTQSEQPLGYDQRVTQQELPLPVETSANPDKKARIEACKASGEECQFCNNDPETCNGVYKAPF